MMNSDKIKQRKAMTKDNILYLLSIVSKTYGYI